MKQLTLTLTLLTLMAVTAFPQASFYHEYLKYQEASMTTRRFKHEDVVAVVGKLNKNFRITPLGKSVEGRSINLISYGQGPVQVLMWSQMHGDETTATRAILDIFKFLQARDAHDAFRQKIKTSITWHFIPMLNPDGAARFTRRNHDGIDINRDALRLQTPEGRILKRVRDSLRADWGFNLHDQGRGMAVNGKPATISLLAPPYNQARDVNDSRGDAMQLIKQMHDLVIQFIPGQVGLYSDDFEPRAFGDNLQKWGTRTILIESGGFADDWEKQEIRRLNFAMLMTAVGSIIDKGFESIPIKAYDEIPKNSDGRMTELIVKNIRYQGIVRDIGIDRQEVNSEDFRSYYARFFISDIGDLSTSSAYKTVDVAGFEVLPGKVYPEAIDTWDQFLKVPLDQLMKDGFTDFVVKGPVNKFSQQVKVNIHGQQPTTNGDVQLGSNPSLIFRNGNKVEYLLINGSIIKVN
ncbi:MAG: peptidase M14 [Cyclobacteriaceae bacterium]|nr:peptidase M14 [Cyclobacteriaceae bacterium]